MTNQLLKHLRFLTGIRPFRNYWSFESLATAASYIEEEFNTYGIVTQRQKWTARGNEYVNIIAKYKPEHSKRLIVGAHYDVFQNQPGADDNASGVAGLLALAEAIANQQPNLPYGIDFVSYCLEEPPFFGTKDMGSYIHAESLSKANADIVGMICLDMIGYFSSAPDSQKYPVPELEALFPSIGDYIAVIGHNDFKTFTTAIVSSMKQVDNVNVEHLSFASDKGLAGLSDHRNYWHFGYPAVMINDTASYRNPNYHQITDLVASLDMNKMTAVVKAVENAILSGITIASADPKEEDSSNESVAPVAKMAGSFLQRLLAFFTRK